MIPRLLAVLRFTASSKSRACSDPASCRSGRPMMRRRAFVAGMAAVIVVVGNGSAQQAGEHKKIGYLYPWSPPHLLIPPVLAM